MRPILFLAAAAAAAAALVATQRQDRNLLEFAAASLKDALEDANAQYQRDSARKTLASYGASSSLAKEIENGAPADIFWSADLDWMDYLEERKLVKPESRFNLLGNKLVLIAPIYSRINLTISPNFPLAQNWAGTRRPAQRGHDGYRGRTALIRSEAGGPRAAARSEHTDQRIEQCSGRVNALGVVATERADRQKEVNAAEELKAAAEEAKRAVEAKFETKLAVLRRCA